MKRTVDKEVKQKLKKEGLEGPRSRFSVRVSATIGKIGPNKEQGPELQIATFLHPSLMKEPNDGTNFGPLQAAAAQWGLWRLSSLEVKCTPLVGSSAVTGSIYRMSLNLTQSPGNASWGGLGARKHKDIPAGKSVSWKLQRGDLAGPRQTWWMTDTNEEGGQSCGPMLEIHGLGKTSSTYQSQDWTGDLFIVEVLGRWEFTNYNAKPALGTLDRKSEDYASDATGPGIMVGDDGVMKMTLPSASSLARFMSDASERLPVNEGSVGETIWHIVDEGAGLASSVAPTPFSWLIKGAWWFVKKLAGRSGANADEQYVVYASLADAQNNKPVMANRFDHTKKATTLTVTQVNSPNTGPGVTQAAYHTENPFPLVPATQPPPPRSVVVVNATARPFGYVKYNTGDSNVKSHGKFNYTQYHFTLKRGSTVSYASAAYILTDVSMLTYEGNRVTGCYDPGWMEPTGITVHYRTESSAFGRVLAYEIDQWGSTSDNHFTIGVWLVQTIKDLPAHDTTVWPYIPLPYVSAGNCTAPPVQVALDKACVPYLTKVGVTSHEQCTVRQPQVRSGTFMLVYSIGTNTPATTAGFTTGQPLGEASNASALPEGKISTSGFWERALSAVAPYQDFISVKFTLPQGPHADPRVDALLDLIQQRFNLKPVDASESEDEDEDSPSGSEEEPCEEEPTPPQPTPRLKLAKEMMYEALRDSDWTHVDAEALLAAISSKN